MYPLPVHYICFFFLGYPFPGSCYTNTNGWDSTTNTDCPCRFRPFSTTTYTGMLHLIYFKSRYELFISASFHVRFFLIWLIYYLLECKYSALGGRDHFYRNRNSSASPFFFFPFFSPKNFKIAKNYNHWTEKDFSHYRNDTAP